MVLEKALELKYLKTNTDVKTKQIITYYYNKSFEEPDFYKKELLANKAIFKSSNMAHREFLKTNQKDFRNKIQSQDSNTEIAILNKESLGISTSKNFFSFKEDALKNVYVDENKINKYTAVYPETKSPEIQFMIINFLEKFIQNESDRLYIAFLLYTSYYSNWLNSKNYLKFEKYFNYFAI